MSKYEESIEGLLSTDSFVAWIEGKATESEAGRWQRWVDNDPARKQLVHKAKILHRNIAFKPGENQEINGELDRFSDAVESEEQSQKSNIFHLNRRTYYSGVAAVIVLLVAVMSIIGYMNPEIYSDSTAVESQKQFVTKSTTGGQKKQLTLYDGSKITLNANSNIRYPANYGGGDLEIWLEGEAFFDVVHHTGNAERSLTVHVTEGSIRVLGTKFNVNTYEDATEVVLVAGSISIEKKDSKSQKLLKPGEMSRISKLDDQIRVSRVKPELFTSWTNDRLIFDSTPLKKVIRRVEHLYDVRFVLDSQELENTPISGSLPNNNLEVFINTLEKLIDRPVTKKGNVITVDTLKSEKDDQQ